MDNLPDSSGETNGLVNFFTGTLSKAVDTATDILALKETQKAVGSLYPTGQVNPAAAGAQAQASKTPAFNYLPFVYIGGGLVALLIVVKALK